MLFLFQTSPSGLFRSIPRLEGLTEPEFLGLKESLRAGVCLEIPKVRDFMGAAGLVDAGGVFVDGDLLADMVSLAGLDAAGRMELAAALPPASPLKKFHDHVLSGPPEKAKAVVGAITKMLEGGRLPQRGTEGDGFEQQLLAAFESHGDFSSGKLSSPSLSAKPHRILWSYKGDLAEGFEQFFSKPQWEQRKLYQLVAEGRIDELAKDHSVKSIAAFKAWHRMSDFRPPPLVTSHVFLHLGKNTLRFSLYCTTKKSGSGEEDSSVLVKAITQALHDHGDQLGADWSIAGPPTHKNLSVSKSFKKKSEDGISACINETIQAWGELEEFLETVKRRGNG